MAQGPGLAPAAGVGGSGTAGALGLTGQGQATNWLNQQNSDKKASGGSLLADITAVGEEGFEYIIKNPQGGYTVIPHDVSDWLMRAGIMPDRGLMFGGEIETQGQLSSGSGYQTQGQLRRQRRPRNSGSAPPVTSGSGASAASSESSVADVVPELAASTEAAVQSSVSAQERQISEGVQTRNVIDKGNQELAGLMQEMINELRLQRSTLPRSLAAAVQQNNP